MILNMKLENIDVLDILKYLIELGLMLGIKKSSYNFRRAPARNGGKHERGSDQQRQISELSFGDRD